MGKNVRLTMFFLIFCASLFTREIQAQEANLISTEKQNQQTFFADSSMNWLRKIKISGYIQADYQYGEEDASLKVGGENENPEKAFNRIGIRRGRIKFTYEERIVSGVFQLDLTENGIKFKDVYLNIKDPWLKTNSLRAGVFDRPFGFEISYSSSLRETPERSTVFQTLFPEERDLGVMLQLQAAGDSPLNFMKLQAGLFAGNGIKEETDSRRDFIGHLSATRNIGKVFRIGGGLSYYHGSVYQGTEHVYRMVDKSFVLDNNPENRGKFAKRQYIGFDVQIGYTSCLGLTQLRGEYLFGEQPGVQKNSKSPNSSDLPETDTYIRRFSGGYVVFIQDLGKLPLSAVLKYDWYDPNVKIKKDEIGLNNTGTGDIAMQTVGVGGLWRINKNLRLQALYEFNSNEKSENLKGYDVNRKDDVFTLRLQYKF